MNRALRAVALGAPILALVAGTDLGAPQRGDVLAPAPALVFMAYDSSGTSDLLVANADGSNVRLLLASADAPPTPSAHRWPCWTSDGRHIVFASLMPIRPPEHPELQDIGPGLYMIDADGANLCQVTPLRDIQDPNPACSPTTQPAWKHSKIVFADRLNDRPCSRGPCGQWDLFLVDSVCNAPAPVNLARTPTLDERFPAWSPDARHISASIEPFAPGRRGDLAVFSIEGEQLTGAVMVERPPECLSVIFPEWSRRGDRIVACCAGEMSGDLWIYSLAGGAWERLSSDGEHGLRSAWSPDDARIIYDHEEFGALSVVGATPGSASRILLAPPPGSSLRYIGPDWSPH